MGNLAILKIDFVPDKDRKSKLICPFIRVVELLPHGSVIQGRFISNIYYYYGTFGILHVVGDEGAEPFLSSRVPQLHPVVFAFVGGVLDEEVDSDGGLDRGRGTLLVSSKVFLMYLEMMEVLPTDKSPIKTIFIFVLPVRVLVDWFI